VFGNDLQEFLSDCSPLEMGSISVAVNDQSKMEIDGRAIRFVVAPVVVTTFVIVASFLGVTAILVVAGRAAVII
jgi:hypothetical protein